MLRFINHLIILTVIFFFEVEYNQVLKLLVYQLCITYAILTLVTVFKLHKFSLDSNTKHLLASFIFGVPIALFALDTMIEELFPNANSSIETITLYLIFTYVAFEIYNIYKLRPLNEFVMTGQVIGFFATIITIIIPLSILSNYGTHHQTLMIAFVSFMMIDLFFQYCKSLNLAHKSS